MFFISIASAFRTRETSCRTMPVCGEKKAARLCCLARVSFSVLTTGAASLAKFRSTSALPTSIPSFVWSLPAVGTDATGRFAWVLKALVRYSFFDAFFESKELAVATGNVINGRFRAIKDHRRAENLWTGTLDLRRVRHLEIVEKHVPHFDIIFTPSDENRERMETFADVAECRRAVRFSELIN